MPKYILAIDEGTTGATALLVDKDLNVTGKANVEFPQHFPQPSWVEHDLGEIWEAVELAVKKALQQSKISPLDIEAIGITNQRETSCVWRKNQEGTPLAKAIVWQDRRTADTCEKLKKKGLEKKITKKTGLLLDPYFSGSKFQWLQDNIPGLKKELANGNAVFGTIDSYLLYRITGQHRTDVSNASRTMLMDIRKGDWDEELLKLFGIAKKSLPEIFPSAVEYGRTRGGVLGLPKGIPVSGLAGDQQAALFGQSCFSPGMAKCTYGTGAFIVLNTGAELIYSKHKLLSTIAWKIGNKMTYALEGSSFIAGAVVQWLRDGLGIINKSSEIEKLALEVSDSGGVVFVPALSGLGAPHWFSGATGMITGITRGTTKAHLARAALEGIAFQVSELLEAMKKDFKKNISQLKVDGGASEDALLMQFQANLLGIELLRSQIIETTALGVALQAGLGVGFWKNTDEIKMKWKASRSFKPEMDNKKRKQKLEKWDRTIQAVGTLS